MVARRETGDAFADGDDFARAFVAEHQRRREGNGAVGGRQVAVADAAGGQFDHHFAALRRVDADGLDDDGLADFAADDGTGLLGHDDSFMRMDEMLT
jgi:hypothetical protein